MPGVDMPQTGAGGLGSQRASRATKKQATQNAADASQRRSVEQELDFQAAIAAWRRDAGLVDHGDEHFLAAITRASRQPDVPVPRRVPTRRPSLAEAAAARHDAVLKFVESEADCLAQVRRLDRRHQLEDDFHREQALASAASPSFSAADESSAGPSLSSGAVEAVPRKARGRVGAAAHHVRDAGSASSIASPLTERL